MGSRSLFFLAIICSAWFLVGANDAAAGHQHHQHHEAPKVEQVQPVIEMKQNEAPTGADVKIEEPQPQENPNNGDKKDLQKRGIDSLEEGDDDDDDSEDEENIEENKTVGLLQRKQPKQKKQHKKKTTRQTTTTTTEAPTTQPEPTTPRRTTTTTRRPTTQPEPTTPTTTRKKYTTTTRPPTTQPEPTTPTTRRTTTTTRRPTTQPEPTTPTTTRKKYTTTTRPPTTQPEPTTPTTRRTTITKRPTTTTRRTTQPNPTTPTTRRTTTGKRPTTTRRTTQPEPTTPTPTKRRTTTTTRRPTTQPNPTEPPSSTDVCLSCADRRNQKDYYANPADCHTFYHCFFFNETFAVGILQNCPPGTFWSDEVLQCLLEGPVPCFDQCRDDAIAASGCHAGNGGNCAEFFQCSNGASQPFCCPAFTRFDQPTCSCVADETCTDICTLPAPIPTTVAPVQLINATTCIDSFGVTLVAVPSNPNQFIIVDNADPDNVINNLANCAVGTEFDVTTCRCNIEVETPVLPSGRQCSLWLPFNTDLQDKSIEKFTTFAYGNADLDTTAAAQGAGSLFVSGGRLEIPGMKNFDFGRAASWCLFFRCQNGATSSFTCSSSGGLFSNNNNRSMTDYSIIMATQATNTFTGRVNFRGPRGSASVSTPVNTPTPGWNQVCVTYDSETVRLYLNGNVVDSEPGTGGSIALGHCPYVVGTDQTFGDFTGNIDEVLACPFVLTQEEISAHFQGNTAFLATEGLIPSGTVSTSNNVNARNNNRQQPHQQQPHQQQPHQQS